MKEPVAGDPTGAFPHTRPRAILWRRLVVVLVATAALVGVATRDSVLQQLKLSFTRQAPGYTELYFPEPAALPTAVEAGDVRDFRFTLANREGRTVRYSYVVTLDSGDKSTVLSDAEIVVEDGQAVSQSVRLTTTQRRGQYLVTVRLDGRAELIHFSGQAV